MIILQLALFCVLFTLMVKLLCHFLLVMAALIRGALIV